MRSIDISPETYSRLEALARGFDDRPENAVARLLNFHDAHQHCPCNAIATVRGPLDEEKPVPVSVTLPRSAPPGSARDNSWYKFEGDHHKKGPLVRAVVAAHVRHNSAIGYAKLREDFPKELQGNYGVVRKHEEVLANPRWKDPDNRFFMKNPIELADGATVVVCSQWGGSGTIQNFPKFLKAAKKLGYQITKLGDDTDA